MEYTAMQRRTQPIETEYNGYRFRSRLEARWAVFFDACGVDWEYEPEGYKLQNGMYYLPDFLLHGVVGRGGPDLYVEVKGEMTAEDAEKIQMFRLPIIVVGRIPEDNGYKDKPLSYGEWIEQIWRHTLGDSRNAYEAYFDYYAREKRVNPDMSWWLSTYDGWEENAECGIPFSSFETVDGDYYPALMCVNEDGNFELLGPDHHGCDYTATRNAYKKARQARFEHGEKG